MRLNSLILLIIVSACQSWQADTVIKESEPVARFEEKYLRVNDLRAQLPDQLPDNTRHSLMEKIRQHWIIRQILLSEAAKDHSLDLAEIDQMVEEYRQSLIVHQYLESKLAGRIDSNVNARELSEYISHYLENDSTEEGKDRAKVLILNAKKSAFIQKWEDSLYKKALSKNRIEKYDPN